VRRSKVSIHALVGLPLSRAADPHEVHILVTLLAALGFRNTGLMASPLDLFESLLSKSPVFGAPSALPEGDLQ